MVRGKIVLIEFPFDDFSETKIRPVLCLTEAIGPHLQTITAFITSNIDSPGLNSDLILEDHDKEFLLTGLMKSSKIQLHRLVTFSCSVIKKELGCVSEEVLGEAYNKLLLIFKNGSL